MAKITVDTALTDYGATKLNQNFQKLVDELNKKVLYRDNPNGEPNQMENALDMNGERILNLPEPVSDNEAARLKDVQNAVRGVNTANLIAVTPVGGLSATSVQGALQELDTEKANSSEVQAIVNGTTPIQFSQDTVGAVARHLSSKVKEIISAKDFGAKGDGTTDDTAAFLAMRDHAKSVKGYVYVPSGTYILAPATDLAAEGTTWYFEAGAELKLRNTQATTSFITFTRPRNQRVFGLRVNGNRGVQNEASFGQDNCAVLVVSAEGCSFDSVEIINSPGKGFALVSEPKMYTRDVFVTNFSGRNCAQQVFIVDGNNITGLFERVVIDGVCIGATTTYGLCLNDGAHNISVSNVISDVQNAVGDGLYVRDSFDIQLTNIRGKRGRNGVFFERLNGYTGRIEMNNIVGEHSEQSGVILLGAEHVTGGSVVGRNNKEVGINIAATSGGHRSKYVSISSPVAYDNQATHTQQYGILVQGVDVCRLGGHIAYENTNKNIRIVRAQTSDVAAEIRQVASGTTGAIAAGSEGVVTLSWPSPFEDDSVDIESAYIFEGTSSLGLCVGHVVAITTSAVQILVKNLSGTTAHTGTLTVIGKRKI